MLTINCSAEGEVKVFLLSGRFESTDKDTFISTIGYQPKNKVVVDLTSLEYLSRTGIECLTFLSVHQGKVNPLVALVQPHSQQVKQKFAQLGIDLIVPFHADLTTAIASLEAN